MNPYGFPGIKTEAERRAEEAAARYIEHQFPSGHVPMSELGEPGVPNDDPVAALMHSGDKPVLDLLGRKRKDTLVAKQTGKPPLIQIETGTDEATKRPVTLIKDHTLVYPDLFLRVMLTGPSYDRKGFPAMFARAACKGTTNIEEADLVVFTGGDDVDPRLYGEERHTTTFFNTRRDDEDMATYLQCLELGIPMLGICRGAQFLHVMNGGKLYQHVDNHNGDHVMWDVIGHNRIERVSSVHHQMVIPNAKDGFKLIATANKAKNRWRNPIVNDIGTKMDVEAFFYRDTCCFGIQGHPEYADYPYFTKWSLDMINELIVCNPDVEWVGADKSIGRPANLRIKADLLGQRKEKSDEKLKTFLNRSAITVQ